MDYGKKNLEKHKKELSNPSARTRKKILFSLGKTVLAVFLVLIAISFGTVGVYIAQLIDDCPDISEVDVKPKGYATTVLDADGNTLTRLAATGANRKYVELSEVPEDLQHAFVAIEDVRFYEHRGIDLRAIIRAAAAGLLSRDFSEGASTITQQLLKNNYFTDWTSESGFRDRFERKIREQYLAVQLEKVKTKDEILEIYLNTINLGQNTLGVEAASERYFNKPVSDLTLSECAVLASITKNPTRYNPITNPGDNAQRRSKVLKNMLAEEYISESDYDAAIADDVYQRIAIASESAPAEGQSYFIDSLTDQVTADLIEQKGYTDTQAYRLLYSGGLTIESTQEVRVQNIVDEEVNRKANYGGSPKISFSWRLNTISSKGEEKTYNEQTLLAWYRRKNKKYTLNYDTKKEAKKAIKKYKRAVMKGSARIAEDGESLTFTLQPQTAMTVIDQSTGEVRAICGGRGAKKAAKTLNRATDTTRQPGSTFKILAAYAPALDAGGQTLASVENDAPMSYSNGRPFKNYDNVYRGYTTYRTGITYSINTVAVQALTKIGTGLGYGYVQDFGISTLESGDNSQALALGGITNGVKNIELAGAYATIANSGEYRRPVFYTRVLDADGEVLLDSTEVESKRVLKETTAWLLTSAMMDVMKIGTGKKANFSGMSLAGKSGTTTSSRDVVFAGYSPYYTCTIWGGFDDNTAQTDTGYAKKIWKRTMKRMHKGKVDPGFERPLSIVTEDVCAKSGKLPIKGVCVHDPRGNMVYTEYFAKDSTPLSTCDHHTQVTLCSQSHRPVSQYCPIIDRTTGIFIIGGGGQDEPYSLSQEVLAETCDIHKGKKGK